MASEYIKYMVGDGKPQEPSPELTPKEKWKNWWHYNWWIVAVVLAAVVAVGSLVLKNLGVTEPLADYNVAYVGSRPLSDETVEAVVATFQEFGEDASGDGVVTVAVNQYVIYENSADVESLQMNSATKALLESDIVARTSYFFILEDPEEFTKAYQALADANGELPPEGDYGWEDKVRLLPDVVDGVAKEDAGLYFGRRGFYKEQTIKYQEACDRLWEGLCDKIPSVMLMKI